MKMKIVSVIAIVFAMLYANECHGRQIAPTYSDGFEHGTEHGKDLGRIEGRIEMYDCVDTCVKRWDDPNEVSWMTSCIKRCE